MSAAVSIAVCAHFDREEMATTLGQRLSAPISWDDGTVGIIENHDRALRIAETWATDWCVVIEDDAEPVSDFLTQAAGALAAIDNPVASLYFGYVGQPRRRISQALDRNDPHWVMKPGFSSAVCIAVRKWFVAPLLQKAASVDFMTVDERYSWAANQLGYKWVPHSHPSLVEHVDLAGIDGDCGIPRHAYSVGGRPAWSNTNMQFYEKLWDWE